MGIAITVDNEFKLISIVELRLSLSLSVMTLLIKSSLFIILKTNRNVLIKIITECYLNILYLCGLILCKLFHHLDVYLNGRYSCKI